MVGMCRRELGHGVAWIGKREDTTFLRVRAT